MHIILLPERGASAKTVTITPRLVALAAAAVLATCFALVFVFSWLGLRFHLPFSETLLPPAALAQAESPASPASEAASSFNAEHFVRDNLSAMTVKLGEMQAQVMRLDSLGERVSKLTGVGGASDKPENKGRGGQGGPFVQLSAPRTVDEMQREIDRLSALIESRTETLTALESQLMERRIKSILLPTITPIAANYIGSGFGRRVDPILGVGAMHEGIDFVADPGTPVIASAGGVVTRAEFHPQYGHMIQIDHGNDFSSLYAHLSKIDVKAGQLVKRGQSIALSGNSGRSTGPHLHFEVRFRDVPQNPARFLQQDTQLALAADPGAPTPKLATARASRTRVSFAAPR